MCAQAYSATERDALTLIRLLEALSPHTWQSLEEISQTLLSQGLCIHRRTLQRQMKALCDSALFPVQADKRSRTHYYRWHPQAPSRHLPALNDADRVLLMTARGLLRERLPEGLVNRLSPLWAQAFVHPDTPNAGAPKLSITPVALPRLAPSVKPAVFQAVATALINERQLQLTYLHNHKSHETRADPVRLELRESRFILHARRLPGGQPLSLPLNRITRARACAFACVPITDDVPVDTFERLILTIRDAAFMASLRQMPLAKSQTTRVLKDSAGQRLYQVEVILEKSPLLEHWLRDNAERIEALQRLPVVPAEQPA